MAAVIWIILRVLHKKGRNVAGFAAFLLHNLMDTSFFYMGTTTSVLFTAGEPDRGGRQLNAVAYRAILLGFLLVFFYYYPSFFDYLSQMQ